MENNPVYWDSEKMMFYWIEWEDTGNGEKPHRHYIQIWDALSRPNIILTHKD